MIANGGAPMPNGILSAEPSASMWTTILVCHKNHYAISQDNMVVYLFWLLEKCCSLVNIAVSASNGEPTTLRLHFHLLHTQNNRLARPSAVCRLNVPKILQEPLLVQLRLHRIQVDRCRGLNHGQGSESAAGPQLILVYGRILQVQVDVLQGRL